MGTASVTVTIEKSGQGYSISIDPFVLEVSQAVVDEIRWEVQSKTDSGALIMIDPDHKGHFLDLVPGTYGRMHASRIDPGIKLHVRFHYKIAILVDDVVENRRGYKNVVCIDPDYKVVP